MSKVGHHVVRDIRDTPFTSFSRFNDFSTAIVGEILFASPVIQSLFAPCSPMDWFGSPRYGQDCRVTQLLYLDLNPTAKCVGFPIDILPVYWTEGYKASQAISGELGHLDGVQMMQGNRVVKIFGREDKKLDDSRRRMESHRNPWSRCRRFRALTGPINEVLAALAVSGVDRLEE